MQNAKVAPAIEDQPQQYDFNPFFEPPPVNIVDPVTNQSPNKNENQAAKETALSIQSSFQDLVIHNDQGQPSIDINRLIYKPKNIKHAKVKEKVSWYLPDYVFVVFNFLCLTCSIYYILIGITLLSWRNSMESFVMTDCNRSSCDCKTAINVDICKAINEAYGQDDMAPFTIIRFYGFVDVANHALGLLGAGVSNIINIIIGITACLVGSKNLLIIHIILDVILIVFEVVLVVILYLTGRCEEKDISIVELFLEKLVTNYAKDEPNELIKKDTAALDLLQLSLSCCGVGSWTDFLPRSVWENGKLVSKVVSERYNWDKRALIIPSSCCRQWWIRNIYCAHEAHVWVYPSSTEVQAHQFRQRISQWGCLPKMVALCRNMTAMAGVGGVVDCIFHFCLSIVRYICAVSQIQIVNTLVRERKRLFRHKEASFGGNVAGVGEEDEALPSLTTILNLISPKVSEVYQRELANKTSQTPVQHKEEIVSNVRSRRTVTGPQDAQLRDWMNTGQAFVEGGNLEPRQTYVRFGEPAVQNHQNYDGMNYWNNQQWNNQYQ